jgi:hypothetical protein
VLLALLAGATASGMTLGAAAGLGVGGGRLGTGQTSVTSCDTDGVGATWTTGIDATLGYTVTSVTVTGINTAACSGLPLSVSLTGASGARLGAAGPVTVTAASMAVPFSPAVPAAPVAQVHVVIG